MVPTPEVSPLCGWGGALAVARRQARTWQVVYWLLQNGAVARQQDWHVLTCGYVRYAMRYPSSAPNATPKTNPGIRLKILESVALDREMALSAFFSDPSSSAAPCSK